MTRSGRGPKKTSTSSSTGKGKDHPIGTFLHVSWRGGTHRAQIIEKRQSVLNPKETEFYVHYTNCNPLLCESVDR